MNKLHILGNSVPVFACISPHHQVVTNTQEREHLPTFGNMADPSAHDPVRVALLDLLAIKFNNSFLRVHYAADGFQDRRFSGAIGAKDGCNPPFTHID